jgi:hypothetical protein
MDGPEFAPDQIVASIETALRECRGDVVPGLIKLLAVQDPTRAADVQSAIDLGTQLARAQARRAAS